MVCANWSLSITDIKAFFRVGQITNSQSKLIDIYRIFSFVHNNN
jgi:hypothetical protein